MYTYAYQARDNHGKITAGIQDAINEDNAITSLMSRGLMVLTISQKGAAKPTKKAKSVKETDLVLFTRQLAPMSRPVKPAACSPRSSTGSPASSKPAPAYARRSSRP